MHSNDEVAEGSKDRRGTYGRNSDGGLKVVYRSEEQQVLHIEIKSPSVVLEDQVYHPDFARLAKIMKDQINRMLKKDFAEDILVFGIVVGGNYIYCDTEFKKKSTILM